MRARLTAFIATPAPVGSTSGNRITALRWAKRLRELGWHVRVAEAWQGEPCDLLVALHARRSHASIVRHARERPHAPRIVALTGTDLYGDLAGDPVALESLAFATRIVVLQPLGVRQLSAHVHDKVRVIRQSAAAPAADAQQPWFTACALSHLRDVKDPLLAAHAISLLPASSSVRVVHIGDAPDAEWRQRATDAELGTGGRWSWRGPLPRAAALRFLAGCQLLVLTSISEGGANVVSEAIAAGVPVVSTRIDGSLGILGEDYPGYIMVGDAPGLANLLDRCSRDAAFLDDLRARIAALRPLVDPARERTAWRDVVDELAAHWPSR